MAGTAGRKRSQLTLFDCTTVTESNETSKRSKVVDRERDFGRCGVRPGPSNTTVGEQSSHSDCDSSDSDREDAEDSEFEREQDCNLSKFNQDNVISISKPSGSMTIIINNNNEGPDCTRASDPALTTSRQPQCLSGTNSRCPQDIAEGPVQSPVQPHVKFPSIAYGTKKRSFSSDWYRKYSWLEYSVDKDAVFCYACRIFGSASRSVDTFTRTGFRDWKHATGQSGMLSKHDTSFSHKQSMLSWCEYTKNTRRGTSIADRNRFITKNSN